jgi:hypothetical protein
VNRLDKTAIDGTAKQSPPTNLIVPLEHHNLRWLKFKQNYVATADFFETLPVSTHDAEFFRGRSPE